MMLPFIAFANTGGQKPKGRHRSSVNPVQNYGPRAGQTSDR
jgi:hypothetical protein